MGVHQIMGHAVFLDRDGVINRLVLNEKTGDYESPHRAEDLELFPLACSSLKRLQHLGFLLFLVSNQPSYAKGKASLEQIKAVHEKLHLILRGSGIFFTEYYYCYHHPQGIVPGYSCVCQCRKPGTSFISHASKHYGVVIPGSWIIGDRDSDIFCGQSAGLSTIMIEEERSQQYRGESNPDHRAGSIDEAAAIIERLSQ